MSFKIEDNKVLVKYNEIWNRIKKMLNIKIHSKPVYDKKYIKAKIKTFNKVVNIIFWNNENPNESAHYTCIVVISIGSVMKIDKKKLSSGLSRRM